MAPPSSRKRSNLKRVDRISALPDHLLCRILAFLPTRYAMATSVLSRRWEHVWTSVPVINFTNDPNRIITDYLISPEEQYESRIRCMNRVLLHNSAPCLERVDFDLCAAITELDRKMWFYVLSTRSVKELNLFYSQHETLRIMLFLDGTLGEHLVSLRLRVHYTLDVAFPSMPHLPRLEKIHLQHLKITDDSEPLKSLILASPRLRELNIVEHGGEINFCCLTLKILKLSTLRHISGIISVPNLEYFELFIEDWGSDSCTDDQYRLILTGEMQHLVEAKVDCCMKLAAWFDFFQTLRHVIKLNVTIRPKAETPETTIMHLKLPYFNRLKCLEIHCIEDHCILQTRMLLKHMPNCVSLIIHMLSPWSSEVEELKGWPEVDSVGLGLQVEYIEIDGFGRNRRASAELLKNLLVCCTGLKQAKLHLYPWGLSHKQKNVMWRTMMNLSWPSGCKVSMDNRSTNYT